MPKINSNQIEIKWQKQWEKSKIFQVKESLKNKFYVLEMFPYPSGDGLHMGHALNYTIGDIYTRFKRMNGFNVLYPMGYDSFGLPAENAAIKANIPPKKYTENSIKNFIKQQKALGLSYDWNRKLITSEPEYYKWDQWIFLKMLEKGLAYKKESAVNWCPKCDTVLANEQVHNGKCWRHNDTQVKIKHLNQWYFKITNYAEELNNFEELENWPSTIKKLQKNWIGKSIGTEINFEINNKQWLIFTTRPDTIYGVTFLVISAQHSELMNLVTKEQEKKIKDFIKKLSSVSEENIDQLEKEGVFTGSYAINPLTKEKIPVYAGNFVLADYGSGMVMAVPAHDQRDFEFAKKYNIPIKEVIQSKNSKSSPLTKAYTEEGILINSEQFNNLENKKAIDEITKFLTEKGLGKKTINFRLRDWLISRQRYWGTPIPIINCNECGAVPVPEKDLPVKLPEKVEFGKGNPLETNKEFINTKCPKCKKPAKRETDTLDTFCNSSWYYLRYTDPKNKKEIFSFKKTNYWCPIDFYIGGKEHACMHLIYIRFYTKFLRDLGLLNFNEPAKRLFNQGMLHGENGSKMSKSLGNVINPLDTIKEYSADALRFFLVSVSSPDSDMNWSNQGVKTTQKFINKILEFFTNNHPSKSSKKIESKINTAIQEITNDIENLKYNIVTIKIRQLFEFIKEEKEISKKDTEIFLKLLHPFCPHLTEELWEKIGNKKFISTESWPKSDTTKINKTLEKQEEALEKTISDINNIINIIKEKENKEPQKVYIYIMPNELETYNERILSKKLQKQIFIFTVNNKDKYDPENKSKKAKPGKPGIYIE